MANKSRALHLTPRSLMITVSCCAILLALVLLLVSAIRSAPELTAGTEPTFQVSLGFDGRYKDGTWIPVHIALSNAGPDFTGTLSINPPPPFTLSGNTSTLYQSRITLPTGAQKQITLYIPFSSGTPDGIQNLDVQLLDIHGHLIKTQSAFVQTLGAGDIFVGLLSDQPGNFGALSSVDLPNRTENIVTEALNASNFPTVAAALDSFDMLVLDNFTTSSLNDDQLRTLQAWIQRGGALVEVGGPSWLRTLASLPDSLKLVSVTDTNILPRGVSLLPMSDPPMRTGPAQTMQSGVLHAPILISAARTTALPSNSTTILSDGTTPLLVQRQQGHGLLYYLAFDPTLEPLASWSGAHLLWQSLLLRTLGDQLLTPNTGAPVLPANGSATGSPSPGIPLIGISMESLLQSMLPRALPLPWPLIALLISYPLMLGPVRLLVIHKLKRRWSWHIVLSAFVVFSSLAYGLSLQQKNIAVNSNSISILQFNQDGAPVHVTTYTGVFLPDQRNFQVNIAGNALAQMLPKAATGDPQAQQATITGSQNGTQIDLNGGNTWTMRTIVSEQDRQIRGSVVPHLTLDHDVLTGTITNTLPYALTDSYILTARGYIHSGPLHSGQTRSVQSSFKPLADTDTTLADQIATNNGLPTPYDLSIDPQKAKTLQQQHIAMLAALSGELSAFTCGINVCSLKNSTMRQQKPFIDPVLLPTPGGDPLLLSNAPATLIGWVDQETSATNAIMVNGATTGEIHRLFVQIPLTLRSPDKIYIPTGTLTAQLVAVQGNNIQTQPGLYLMTTGSMTFELTVPQAINIQKQAFNISLMPYPPDGVYQLGGSSTRMVADDQRLHISLYNWRNNTWETTLLHQYVLTVQQQAYVGPGQRILFKLNNQDASLGTFIFGTPLANL